MGAEKIAWAGKKARRDAPRDFFIIGGRGVDLGAPSVVRKFVGKGGGCPDVGVRGSGVEGGLRPVPRGRPAKKKKKHAVYSISVKKGKWSKKVYF